MIEADGEGDAHPDGAGEGVAAADPVPETEDVLLRYTELLDALDVGAQGCEMISYASFTAAVIVEPLPGRSIPPGLRSSKVSEIR